MMMPHIDGLALVSFIVVATWIVVALLAAKGPPVYRCDCGETYRQFEDLEAHLREMEKHVGTPYATPPGARDNGSDGNTANGTVNGAVNAASVHRMSTRQSRRRARRQNKER